MHRTIFNTPLINTLMHWLSRLILRLLGWRIEGKAPAAPKCVLIAAPHTSNWDFPITLMVCFALRMPVYWMGKASLFPPIFGGIKHWLPAIAILCIPAARLLVDAGSDEAVVTTVLDPADVTAWRDAFPALRDAGLA